MGDAAPPPPKSKVGWGGGGGGGAKRTFAAGQKVEARYKGKAKWYGGVVSEANVDGSYKITYDDGDVELKVREG